MKYLAVTQETATWLLSQTAVIDAIVDVLKNPSTMKALQEADLAEGPIRMSGSADGLLCALWNVDYLTGTGDEAWGMIRLENPLGLLDEVAVARKVFDTELQLISTRLQGLRLDGSYIHRTYPNGSHTMRADRGEQARRLNLGYAETVISDSLSDVNSLLVLGPARDFDQLSEGASEEGSLLPRLVKAANTIIAPLRRRPLLDVTLSNQLRFVLVPEPKKEAKDSFSAATVATTAAVADAESYLTAGLRYRDWIKADSPLSQEQREILKADLSRPIRIVGPAGSGKSLVMQLLALRLLDQGVSSKKILYIVHNAAMERSVIDRFEVLADGDMSTSGLPRVSTLSDYAHASLGLEGEAIIDQDAYATKRFQLTEVRGALDAELGKRVGYPIFPDGNDRGESNVFRQLFEDDNLLDLFAKLIMAEISTAIKGHGLIYDRQRYVFSDRSLSRLHRIMGPRDRDFVFDVFEKYHNEVFEKLGVLDADDIAVSLLGRLRTPIWQLKRRDEGFDYVFVDETQLFNENERRIFRLLTKGTSKLAPIALALDEGQEFFGQTSAGFAALGIEGIEDERLPSNHRSTKGIVDLSFFVIEKTTDLFGPDFPRYSKDIKVTLTGDDKRAAAPRIEYCNPEAKSLGRFVARKVSEVRRHDLRRIAVICHTDQYWEVLENELRERLREDKLPFRTLLQRGELLPGGGPLCVLTRPAYAGGQEFDAVIVVGLEQGVVPPRIVDNPTLEAAVEQQALREMYLSFSRARLQLIVVLNLDAQPNQFLKEALDQNLISIA